MHANRWCIGRETRRWMLRKSICGQMGESKSGSMKEATFRSVLGENIPTVQSSEMHRCAPNWSTSMHRVDLRKSSESLSRRAWTPTTLQCGMSARLFRARGSYSIGFDPECVCTTALVVERSAGTRVVLACRHFWCMHIWRCDSWHVMPLLCQLQPNTIPSQLVTYAYGSQQRRVSAQLKLHFYVFWNNLHHWSIQAARLCHFIIWFCHFCYYNFWRDSALAFGWFILY
jgi:hypothetical protein